MMTAVMDRLRTAPERRHARPDSAEPAADAAPTGVPRGPLPSRLAPVGSARSPGRPVQPALRVAMGVLAGALVMFAVATLDTFAGATVPVLGTFAALPAPAPEPRVVEVPPPPATPGTCLNWTRADAVDATVVDCAQPHLFEQAGSVALTDQPKLPDDGQWRQLVNERCSPVVLTYLGGKFDPDGRYRVGALKPSPAKWEEGDRGLRCGLQSASRSGALYPMAGRVADGDQAAVREPGTCLAIDGRTVGDPVACTGPHAVETVGIVDMAARFPDAFPQVADQDAFLQPECDRIANEYAGGAEVIAAKKLTVYWDNLTAESWAAGTRKVNCNLAALLPDRSGFAPVTGSVRGDVVVGQTAAPPASDAPEAGVPAPVAPAPSSAQAPAPANPTPDGPPQDGVPQDGAPQDGAPPAEAPAPDGPPAADQPAEPLVQLPGTAG